MGITHSLFHLKNVNSVRNCLIINQQYNLTIILILNHMMVAIFQYTRFSEQLRFVTKSSQQVKIHIKNYEGLVRYAASITKDWALSEDIVQDAFLRIGSKSPNAPDNYLRRIVHNLCIDQLRKQQRELQRFDHETPITSYSEQKPTQESALADKQELKLVIKALAELPQITRKVVELHRLEGLKLREIASRLNLSVTQTHEHLHTGIKHCMRVLNAKR